MYYTESKFKEHFDFKQKGNSNFSLVHFNCRSTASNFDKLKDSVKGLDFPFLKCRKTVVSKYIHCETVLYTNHLY